jgi:G:T-mismatch repair DNA endonuclease (very short patch repair protein)
VAKALHDLDWRVFVVWECEVNQPKTIAKLERGLKNI